MLIAGKRLFIKGIMSDHHNLGTVALIPYWLHVHPKDLHKSDHFWWFKPLAHFKTVLYVGPYVTSGIRNEHHQTIITIQTTSLTWSTLDIRHKILEEHGISLCDISILWHVIEASGTCRITDLGELDCPLIAVIADTHHLESPISSLIPYLRQSQYTNLTCTHNQHAPFFQHTCNIPTFSFPYTNPSNRAGNLNAQTIERLIYYGNLISPHHVFRTRLVNKLLTQSSLTLGGRLSFGEWLKALSRGSQYVLTCSLNGSFSFQTLMPLLFDNIIISDPLSSANWLGGVLPFLPGCFIYHNLDDCLDIINDLENSSSHDQVVQNNGLSAELLRPFLSDTTSLMNAFTPEGFFPDALPDVSTDSDTRLSTILTLCYENFGLAEIEGMVRVYEKIQELHRVHWHIGISPVKKRCGKSAIYDAFLRQLPALLPRVKYPDEKGLSIENHLCL